MNKKIVLFCCLLVLVVSYWLLDIQQYLELNNVKSHLAAVEDYVRQHLLVSLLLFFFCYVVITGLSLPGALILTLVSGHLFGFWLGLLTVSFASTLGATLAFLSARYLLRSWVESRFQRLSAIINLGVEKDGKMYLFSLRLVPLFPFFAINLACGITRMRVWSFYWVSQLGMLAGTMVYVNAGVQLSQLESISGVMSFDVVFSFILLAAFPYVARVTIRHFKRHRMLKKFNRPKRFDANLLVVGAGSAGLVAAYIAATVKSKVYLVEKNEMGGDCLNTGCVPSKALISVAKTAHNMRCANKLGFRNVSFEIDFNEAMRHVHQAIKKIEPHDSVERYERMGVRCVQGEAKIKSPFEVEVDGRVISTKKIIIASGASPAVPKIPGIEKIKHYTSDDIWSLQALPKRLLILGAGPIGCELAQAFAHLGANVTMVDRNPRVLSKEDADVSDFIATKFRELGIELFLESEVVEFDQGDEILAKLENTEGVQTKHVTHVLLALGRKANTQHMGLEDLGVRLRENGTIETDEYLESSVPGIFASGDVTGPFQLTHAGSHQSWYATVNALFGGIKKFRVDYRVMPRCTFVSPEVAAVGLNEKQAQASGVEFEKTMYKVDALDRAIAENNAEGFVKVLTVPGKDTILGATIVADNAGEMISEFVLAMKQRIGLNKILSTVHAYPTMAEANKYAAGEWKRQNAPQRVLSWLERYHRWRRNSRL